MIEIEISQPDLELAKQCVNKWGVCTFWILLPLTNQELTVKG